VSASGCEPEACWLRVSCSTLTPETLGVIKSSEADSIEIAAKEIVARHIALDFPRTASIAVHVDGPPWIAARLAPSAGLVVVQASQWAMRIERTRAMASKQAQNAAKVETGEANQPTRKRETRRRNPRARSGSAAAQTDPAAVLPEASNRGDGSQNATEAADQGGARADPVLEVGDLETASVPGASRPPASTKRAALIGMLERPEGASVAEIGQRLGWLPHTVRAAITGLRHTGREVTRSKDDKGQSMYRIAPVEAAER
jgi:hypothetical protein